MKTEIYTGIGSRSTPKAVCEQFTDIARRLALADWALRTGGAEGADTAFEDGAIKASGRRAIFLPWAWFAGRTSSETEVCDRAMLIASTIHPAWNSLNEGSRKLHGRNIYQVLGKGLDRPSAFVLCWTPDGCESSETRTRVTGGTGTAIAIASIRKIPVYNYKNANSVILFEKFLFDLGV